MPDFKPFIVIGLALGGVYAMSGVGLVVLFRTTGVLNLSYGAVGALGSLVAFTLIDHEQNEWMAYGVAIVLAGVLTLIYGRLLGPPLANRDPLVKASAVARLRAHPARLHAVALDRRRAQPQPADERVAVHGVRTTGCASTGRRRSA